MNGPNKSKFWTVLLILALILIGLLAGITCGRGSEILRLAYQIGATNEFRAYPPDDETNYSETVCIDTTACVGIVYSLTGTNRVSWIEWTEGFDWQTPWTRVSEKVTNAEPSALIGFLLPICGGAHGFFRIVER